MADVAMVWKKMMIRMAGKRVLLPEQEIPHGPQDQAKLEDHPGLGQLFELCYNKRRDDEADTGAQGSNGPNLGAAEPNADIKQVHERQDKSPSAHEAKVIRPCEKQIFGRKLDSHDIYNGRKV